MKIMGMHEGSVPAGWADLSAGYGKLLRGASTAGGTGGLSTHTHSVSFPSGVSAMSELRNVENVYTDLAYGHHTHSIPAESGLSSGTASSLPLYKDVRLIYYEESFDEV